MPTVEEIAATQGTPLAADLSAGLDAISYFRTITFTKYVKLILPLDGFIFWVKADLLSPSALLNASSVNTFRPGQAQIVTTPATTIVARGSMHYTTEIRQEETETIGINSMVFTTTEEIVELNEINHNVLFIATVDDIRFAFSTRGSFFKQSNLYHYRGAAVYSDMATQIIDKRQGFDSHSLVVSNSLPAWLSLNGYVPVYQTWGNPILPIYPSYAVPPNLRPPWIAVHIVPESTKGLQPAAFIAPNFSHFQLVEETVIVTMYGVRSNQAIDFVDCVCQWSIDYGVFGITNLPVIRDEKRPQRELGTLSMKKSVEFHITYHQTRINDIARKIIVNAVPTIILGD